MLHNLQNNKAILGLITSYFANSTNKSQKAVSPKIILILYTLKQSKLQLNIEYIFINITNQHYT